MTNSDTTSAPAPESSVVAWTDNASVLRRRLEFEQLLSEVSTYFINLSAEEIDRHINTALGRVASFFGFNLAAITQFSQQSSGLEVTHIWTAAGLPPIPPGYTQLDFPWVGERIAQGQGVYLTSLDVLPLEAQRDRQTYERHGIQSIYNWPLQVGGAVVGALSFASVANARGLPTDFEQALRLLAQIMASSLARARDDRALHESEAKLSLAADAAGAGLWELNLATHSFWLTKKTRELFDFNPEEVVSFDRFLSLVHPDDQDLIRRTLQTVVESKSEFGIEYRVLGPGGSLHWILSRGRFEGGRGGRPDRLMGVSVNITARKQVEAELLQQRAELAHVSRVSTLGELAASVAHELNQPLGAILANAEAAELFLEQEPPPLDELRAILAAICMDDERAGEVIRRMRNLLRKRELERVPLDMNSLVEDVLQLVSGDASLRGVSLSADLAPSLPKIDGDRVHLQQVLLNLIINGMDAMAGEPRERRRMWVRTRVVAESQMELAVIDSGHGIEPEKLGRLFEPFFTTKANGMGMGLSIARTIIEAHHGRIWAENNTSEGAAFRILLPTGKPGRGDGGKNE